jgi:nitronate monooxygenase
MSPPRLQPGDLREPIVGAPLAGGPSTVALAAAVSAAGGLGFLAAGYLPAAAVKEQIAELRESNIDLFGVNIFASGAATAEPLKLRDYLLEIAPEARRQGTELGEPRFDDDGLRDKLAVVIAERVPVVSFTFGCPAAEAIGALHEAQIAVWVTVTNAEEAARARAAGADALILQGIEAGGHRASWTDDDQPAYGLLSLLRIVAEEVPLPLIAAGGIADGRALAAVLCAGASAAAVGTALMLSPEAGTSATQRRLFGEHRPTQLTRAFTGRLARGIVNRFMNEHDSTAPSAYPEIHHATRSLRALARERGDPEALNLWAGQAYELARQRPAAEIVGEMGAQARRVIGELAATAREPR